MKKQPIIGIDPGTDKCGVAVLDAAGRCQWRSVEATRDLVKVVDSLATRFPDAVVVLGDGTGSDEFVKRMQESGLSGRLGQPILIDEYRSTEIARERYLRENRRGWRRFVPIGLQSPDRSVDDYVAEVLAKRYWNATFGASEGRSDPDL